MTLRQIAERYGLTPDGVDFALSQYQIVISEITHGMMSKLSYYAKDIIQVAQERWCDTCDLKAISGWISVKDRLPEESDGTVLICYPNQAPYNLMEPYINAKHNRRVVTGCYSQHSRTWYHGDMRGVGGDDPIAWMPLPEPPKEEE